MISVMKAVKIMVIVSNIQGNFAYTLTSSAVRLENGSDTTVYGISIVSLKDNQHHADIEDISDDFLYVYGLFGMIVAEELYPEHLISVVEDYLSDKDSSVIPINGYLEYHFMP